ncbi:MAG: hypothetical protein IKA47_05405 [Oscillospiraceae bacterium]|nr:hypothetical protein [Oscillospiraceae bacterium]
MKKLLAILLTLTILFSFAACAAKAPETPETTADKGKTLQFTVIVTHKDKTEKIFLYECEGGMLGAFLEKEGLIIGSGDGMFHTVNGEKADWNENQSYWAFYVDNNYAVKGIYETPIENGKNYKLEYTIG